MCIRKEVESMIDAIMFLERVKDVLTTGNFEPLSNVCLTEIDLDRCYAHIYKPDTLNGTAVGLANCANINRYDIYLPLDHVGKTDYVLEYFMATTGGQKIKITLSIYMVSQLSVRISAIEIKFYSVDDTNEVDSKEEYITLERMDGDSTEEEFLLIGFWNGISIFEPEVGRYGKEHKGIQLPRTILDTINRYAEDDTSEPIDEPEELPDFVIADNMKTPIPLYPYSIRQLFMTLVTQWGLSLRYYEVVDRILNAMKKEGTHPQSLHPHDEYAIWFTYDKEYVVFHANSPEERLCANFVRRVYIPTNPSMESVEAYQTQYHLYLTSIAVDTTPTDGSKGNRYAVAFPPVDSYETMDSIEELWINEQGMNDQESTYLYAGETIGNDIRTTDYPVIYMEQYLSLAPLFSEDALPYLTSDSDEEFVRGIVDNVCLLLFRRKFCPGIFWGDLSSIGLMTTKLHHDLEIHQFSNEIESFLKGLEFLGIQPIYLETLMKIVYEKESDDYSSAANAYEREFQRKDSVFPCNTSTFLTPTDMVMLLDRLSRCDDGDAIYVKDVKMTAFNIKRDLIDADKWNPELVKDIIPEKEDDTNV